MSEHDSRTPEMEDARIAALYRRASTGGASRDVDARIAAAARAAVVRPSDRKPQPWWVIWRVPFAVAATAVVSVSLVSLMIERDPDRVSSVPEAPPAAAPTQRPPDSIAQPKNDAAQPVEARADRKMRQSAPPKPQRRERAAQVTQDRTAAVPAGRPPTDATASDSTLEKREAAALRAESATRSSETGDTALRDSSVATAKAPPATAEPAPPPVAAPAPKAAPAQAARPFRQLQRAEGRVAGGAAVAAMVAELASRPPADWRERIVSLRREGRREEADALLEEFKRRFPDEPLPSDPNEK